MAAISVFVDEMACRTRSDVRDISVANQANLTQLGTAVTTIFVRRMAFLTRGQELGGNVVVLARFLHLETNAIIASIAHGMV